MTFYYEGVDKVVDGTAEAMGNGDSMFVKAGVTIGSAIGANGVTGTRGETIQVFGTIMSVGRTAFFATGFNENIRIGVGGAIAGSPHVGAGIRINGSDNDIVNDGMISGYDGIFIGGGFNQILNGGSIAATHNAILLGGAGDTITNTGRIASTSGTAIVIDGGGGDVLISNTGTIEGGREVIRTAISVSGGPVQINNTGHIGGNIVLGGEDDVYDGSNGTLNGSVSGQDGNDELYCGSGRDFLAGGAGRDTMEGGAGRDTFYFDLVSDSTGLAHDAILDFDARRDSILVTAQPTAVDAPLTTGTLNRASFNADMSTALSGHFKAHHAELFTPNAGNERGHTFLVIDGNGQAGYQAGQDYVIELKTPDNLDQFSLDSFG